MGMWRATPIATMRDPIQNATEWRQSANRDVFADSDISVLNFLISDAIDQASSTGGIPIEPERREFPEDSNFRRTLLRIAPYPDNPVDQMSVFRRSCRWREPPEAAVSLVDGRSC